MKRLLYVLLLTVFLLRFDFWQWNDDRLFLGLPIGLTYHVLFCFVTVVVMTLLVRFAWPSHLETGEDT